MLIAFAQWVQLPSSFMLLNSCSFAPSNNTNCKTFKNIEAMKRVLSIVAILIVLSVSVSGAKNIVKETETFTISANDHNVDQSLDKSWTIQYNTANKGFEVIKVTTKKGEEYIVRNSFFEVRYVNTENGFGVRRIRNSQSKVDSIITDNVINENELTRQSLLSSEKLNEEKALSIIAGFVPFLLNENYKHILN